MSNFADTLKNLGPARLAVLLGVIIALLAFFIFVSTQVSEPRMSILYSDLTTTDSGNVSGALQAAGINFTVSPDGARVYVPHTEIGKARMLLAEKGLPNGGSMGYEIFDKSSGFGTTSFVQNINQVRALQGELARTISSLDPVEFAKVHIVLPQRELFSRENRESSASVTLKLVNSGRLSRAQIFGIQNLVANAVPSLEPKHVTIIDTEANLLARGSEEDGDDIMGLKAEEMRRSYERRMTQAIEDLVGRTVGLNNVRAHVTADLDFDRISTNDEIYNPEGQVVRSTQTISEDNVERTPQPQDVTVENNLPGLGEDADGDTPTSQGSRTEEITNFEISKTIRSTVRESGEVQKLSVAVLVDGHYTTDEEGNRTYEPRSQEEIDQIASLVRSAVGFNEERGDSIEVVNMPFADVSMDMPESPELIMGFEKNEILDMGKLFMFFVMVILVLLLVIRPLVGSVVASQKAVIEQSKEEAAMLQAQITPALAGPGSFENADGEEFEGISGGGGGDGDTLIDMKAVEGKVKASAVKKVGDIVSSHPNETVSVLRNWMAQE